MNLLQWLYDAQVTIAGHPITWREILGNAFGFASATRRTATHGLGLARRHRRQRPAVHASSSPRRSRPARSSRCSGRPDARCSSSSRASTAGGAGSGSSPSGPRPRPPSPRAGRPRSSGSATSACGSRGSLVCQWLFSVIGAGYPAPRWYYWCDAWIFVGSMVATYAMARGWIDFWLAWIAVDLVGVPLLWHSQLLPDRDPLRRVRRPRDLGLRGLAARQPNRAGPRSRRTPSRPADRRRGVMTVPTGHHRARRRRHRRRQGGRRRRRRGPRERGRPHLRRQQGDARADGVHDPPQQRRDLRADAGRRCSTGSRSR